MAYASPTDLTNVYPSTSFGNLTAVQIAAALQEASDFADSFFRARYGASAVPFLAWDTTVTRNVAKIAAYYLMTARGYKSQSGADREFRLGYADAEVWLNKVQRQQAHPLVTLAAVGQPGTPQPNLISSSVVNLVTGRTAPNRGW